MAHHTNEEIEVLPEDYDLTLAADGGTEDKQQSTAIDLPSHDDDDDADELSMIGVPSSSKKKYIVGATVLGIVAVTAVAIGVVSSNENKTSNASSSINAMENENVFAAGRSSKGSKSSSSKSGKSSSSYSRSDKQPTTVAPSMSPMTSAPTTNAPTSSPMTSAPTLAPNDDITCSCSPNFYSFKLDFSGTCSQSINNPGTDGSICFFTQGGNPDDLDTNSLAAGFLSNRRRLGTTNNVNNNEQKWMDGALSNVDFTKQLEHAQLNAGFEQEIDSQRRLKPDTTPTIITSVTFLETDTTPELNVINQDSTYFEFTGTNGQIITYESISTQLNPSIPLSEQEDGVPGGVFMVLFGINAAGVVIQNTVAWGYTRNYCDGVPLNDDDAIGWITLDSYVPPYSAFCEGVTGK